MASVQDGTFSKWCMTAHDKDERVVEPTSSDLNVAGMVAPE